jgi:MFS transporter, PHS family, inorganic phosphate transporter
VLEIYALFMLLGCFSTLLIPETARKTLEELSGEDDYATSVQVAPMPANGTYSGAGVLEKQPEESL